MPRSMAALHAGRGSLWLVSTAIVAGAVVGGVHVRTQCPNPTNERSFLLASLPHWLRATCSAST